ncbi:MAG: type I-U CRISPR-associated protein Cas7 [Acidothermus sp.]|nr:type I-U CRISPR-associated protein Cas7 [Acidothermus sp.]
MDVKEFYERLAAAVSLEGEDAAIRFQESYESAAGAGSKVSPPTYPVEERGTPYLFEERRLPDGTRQAVLLDSRQSQANRCEEALARVVDEGKVYIPHLVLEVTTHDRRLRITSLTAPHRSRDAYFRDAEDAKGTPFDKTQPGQELAACTPEDATALYRYAPTDLVYGVLNSHRRLRLAAKFPRVYTSEMVGWDPEEGKHAAGRFDLITSGRKVVTVVNGTTWEIDNPKGKKKKLSELGLGAIPPSTKRKKEGKPPEPVPGGVTVAGIERLATLSFSALARVRLGSDSAVARAGRIVLAALALLGDRLAFDGPGLFLRSGCDLVKVDGEVSWVQRGGSTQRLDLDREAALALFTFALKRAEDAGLAWDSKPIVLRPQRNLQQAIDEAFFAGIDESPED